MAGKVILVTGASSGFSEVVSAVADRVRVEFFRRTGLDDLLTAHAAL